MRYADWLPIIVAIAQEAGALLRQGWGAVTQITYKGEVNLVTEYDLRAEEIIVRALRQRFPQIAIYAEEQGGGDPTGWEQPTWLIDPLDGTTNFAHGFPAFAVSIALVAEGEPVLGVIYDPLLDETFAARRGGGATLNDRPIHVSAVPVLDKALLATGFAYDRRTRPDNNVGHFAHFLRRCQGMRRAGAAALDLAYVACGRLDGFWELRLHPWDVAAGILLVQEAGGRVTDLEGGPRYHSGEQIVASNGLIHEEMLAVFRLGDRPEDPLLDGGA